MSIQLFKKWTQAVVNSDWDSMSSLYAEDIVNLNPDGTTNVGKEACLEKDKGWDSAFSDFKFDVVNSMESGNTTVMEVQITCTMTGEMMTPDGSKIPPTGKTHTFPYCMIMEWEKSQIRRQRNWSSPQKVVHLLVWEINPIRNMKGGLKWLRKDTNPKKS